MSARFFIVGNTGSVPSLNPALSHTPRQNAKMQDLTPQNHLSLQHGATNNEGRRFSGGGLDGPFYQSGKGGLLSPPPHTTWHAGPHQAVPKE